jgi:hypothetical protein
MMGSSLPAQSPAVPGALRSSSPRPCPPAVPAACCPSSTLLPTLAPCCPPSHPAAHPRTLLTQYLPRALLQSIHQERTVAEKVGKDTLTLTQQLRSAKSSLAASMIKAMQLQEEVDKEVRGAAWV